VGEVVGNPELDRRVLDAANLADTLCELAGPAAALPAEDCLQRLAPLPLADVPGEDVVAVALARRLRNVHGQGILHLQTFDHAGESE